MTLIINIPPELESQLQKEASRKGVALDEYARMLIEEQLGPKDHQASRKGDAWAVLKSMLGLFIEFEVMLWEKLNLKGA